MPVDAQPVAVVGAGRVGTALVAALAGAAGPFGRGFDGGDHRVVLLAVPDREIASAAAAIARLDGRLVGHCSGATTLDVLAPHERFGLHPLMTFSRSTAGAATFTGASAAVAGSSERALDAASSLAEQLGMRPFVIDDAHRAAYHAAASISSNFLVTVEDAAEVLLGGAGPDREILLPLIRATVENWGAEGRAALTGPVARGDTATVERQRAAIAARAPELLALFDALVERTQAISGARPSAG